MTSSDGNPGSRHGVAVTKATDFDLPPPVPGSPKNLPNEVLLMIFKSLQKDQLKAVRCVGRDFAQLVSPLLFDKIYFSPHRPNLDVFCQIAEHQDLCRYPRTLIYDLQEFTTDIKPDEYYAKLCHQLYHFLLKYPKSTIQHVDTELKGLLHMAKVSCPATQHPATYDALSTCRIVQRGLEIYSKEAAEQDHYNNKELLACLCLGLTRLTNVDKVKFQWRWSDSHLRSLNWSKTPRDLRFASSPLARSWSPFHLMPGSSTPGSDFPDAPCAVQFDNVITAFSLTKRPLRELDVVSRPSVACEIFDSKSSLSHTFRQHSFSAMYYLENLSLKLDRRHHSKSGSGDSQFEYRKENTLSVNLLGVALHHMPGLRRLSVFGSARSSDNGLLAICELFHDLTLPALEDLDLCGMLGSAAEICAFLRAQSRLRKLSLQNIELSEGTWVGLLDDMRKWLRLDSLNLGVPLREKGAVDIWDEGSWMDLEVSAQIENYVVHGEEKGGVNPLVVVLVV